MRASPFSRLRLIGAVLLLVCLMTIGRVCIFRPATSFSGQHFNRGANAAWLDIAWVKDPHDAAEIVALADDLNRLQIRYIFAYANYLKPDGGFNPTYTYAADFTRAVKAAQPNLNVQAWIGLPIDENSAFSGRGYVDLSDPEVRQKIASFCANLVRQGGFDGIHLDPEPILNDDESLLRLLEEVRSAIGPDTKLSIATRRIWPIFPETPLPYSGQFGWGSSYYREVARRVNHIAVMVYDTGLPSSLLYRQWTRFQVIEVSRAVDGMDVDVLIGVPTSEEKTRTHWPRAENMVSGLQGTIDGLKDVEARPSAVAGIAIYPHWETDAREWTTYESLWLGR